MFKSTHFPDEIVAARRGSPLLIGVKTERKLKVDFVDVELASEDRVDDAGGLLNVPVAAQNGPVPAGPKIRRSQSRTFLSDEGRPPTHRILCRV